MGLWDFVKEVGKTYLEDTQKNVGIMREWEERYSTMSKEQLKAEYQRFKNGSISASANMGARLAALKKVCRERGYINS